MWGSDSELTHFLVRGMNEFGWLAVGFVAMIWLGGKCHSSAPPNSDDIGAIMFTLTSRPFFMVWTAASLQASVATILVPMLIVISSPHTSNRMSCLLVLSA